MGCIVLGMTFEVRKTNFQVHFQTAGPQHSVVDKLLLVGEPNHENVAELVHSVELGQELVYYRIAHATGVAAQTPSLRSQGAGPG